MEMKIPFVDLKAEYTRMKTKIDAAIKNVIDNTTFVHGPDVEAFEKEFAQYCNSNYCVSTNSGTSALLLALRALGIKKGDEVITTPHTFIATAEVIAETGATPVFADINEKTSTIDPEKIKEKISQKTKAIIVVHLYGYPCQMDEIMEIAKQHNLKVVEDCAQAHGAEYKGKKIPIGDIGCFSFYPAKNLGCFGDGGAIVFNEKNLYEKLAALRNHGREPGQKYEHSYLGYNERMDTIHAAVLRVKLNYLEEGNKRRREIAAKYNHTFRKLADSGKIILPFEDPALTKSVYYVYTVRIPAQKKAENITGNVRNSLNRDTVIELLKAAGIPSQIYFPIPLHLQPAFKFLGLEKGSFPISEKVCSEILSLPVYPDLTNEQQDYIIENVMRILE